MEKIEKYQSELGEKAVKTILESWYALTLKKIPKSKGIQTPDYEIRDADGEVIAACEVKSCVDANVPLYNPSILVEDSVETSRKRDRNHRSKLQRHHAKAMSQLAASGSLTTVVIFVSFDMTDPIDMAMVLQEYRDLYSAAVMADLYMLIKIHQAIIPSDTFVIKQTTQIMHSNEQGERFGRQYMSLEEALENRGVLPATFQV